MGKALRNGPAVKVVADVNHTGSKEANDTSAVSEVAVVKVSSSSVDTIILGSAGFW